MLDPRKLWDNIRTLTHTKEPRQTSIELEGTSDAKEAFAAHFSTIAEKTHQKIPKTNSDPTQFMQTQEIVEFDFSLISQDEAYNIMKGLKPKRSSGMDGISSKLVKLLAAELSKPMQDIINKIISSKSFPTAWKKAKVVPLYKNKGNTNNIDNYRPISLLPSLSKIAEKVMTKQMYNYLELMKLLPETQFGFRQGRSTEQAISHLVYEIEKAKKSSTKIAVILLDFSKAFDVISHKILKEKLAKLGFSRNAVELITSYLSERTMRVCINGEFSKEKPLGGAGAPQGSVCGPLLYLIYTTDIPRAISDTCQKVSIFADDTALIIHNPTDEKIKTALNNMNDYSAANKLKLNVSKTEIISNAYDRPTIISTAQGDIHINTSLHSVRYLGVKLNISLNWSDHIKQVKSKMMVGLKQLFKLKGKAPAHVLRSMYECLVKSHIQYSICSWGACLGQNNIHQIERMQKMAIRCILNKTGPMHFRNKRKELKILKVSDIYKINAINYLMNIFSTKNCTNPIRSNFKCVETTTRAGMTILPVKMTNTLQSHARLAREYSVHLPLTYTKKTTIKNEMISILQTYESKCETKHCYVCKKRESDLHSTSP